MSVTITAPSAGQGSTDGTAADASLRSPVPPVAGCRLVIVGPGRVGCSFGHWLRSLGARLVAVSGRRRSPDADLLLAAGGEWRPLETVASADADVVLIAVADPALADVAAELAERPQAAVALHVSGHFDAAVLAPLAVAGVAAGSLHPLRAFTATSRDPRDAEGVTFAYDGDLAAARWARAVAEQLGGHAIELAGERRMRYHLAATLAAGGVVSVLAAMQQILRATSDDPRHVAQMIDGCVHLTRGALDQLPGADSSFANAITGPAARGDVAMLERQRAALSTTHPQLVALFDALVGLAP